MTPNAARLPADSNPTFAVATGTGQLEVMEAPRAPLQRGHVCVSVAFVGVCHSDTAMVREGQGPFPARLGHEVSGTIIESADSALPPGTPIAAYVSDGYATEIMVPIERAIPLDPGCSLLDAALSEPLACVIGGLEILTLSHEHEVILVGAGFMGLMAARLLATRGHRVTVIEPRAEARKKVRALGATRVLHPDDVPSEMIANCSTVIEATGGRPDSNSHQRW